MIDLVECAGATMDKRSRGRVARPAASRPPSRVARERGGGSVAERPAARKVLVVDDDPDMRAAVAEFLNMQGFEVVEASNGLEALLQVKRLRPHGVVLDIMMPRLGGVQALRHIRAFDPRITVVVVSGVTDADLLLGYVDGDYFLGGRLRLDRERARAAFEPIATRVGLGLIETVAGAVRVVEHQMADLIRKATVQKGYDPRDCVVYAYGGAGPVHAGVIEPGHFRFSVLGETIIDMKVRLYFTHKGTEKLFEGRRPADGVRLAERVSGDTTVGHALAFCQAVEAAAGVAAPARARWLRVVLLELERLYNHVGDVGMILNDTGFAVAHSHCFRIRERLLRLNKRVTGNRLLRGGLVPGGVTMEAPAGVDVAAEVDAAVRDFDEIVGLSLGNTLVADRLDGTGRLTLRTARDHGVLGPVARASGIDADVRRDHPFAAYAELAPRVVVHESGDARARTLVRVEEARESARLIRRALETLPEGPLAVEIDRLPAGGPAFSLVEGWRGAIVHWVLADETGALARVKVLDPSFLNWPALSYALLTNIVPDFPLCNKSFNQSYSGNDL